MLCTFDFDVVTAVCQLLKTDMLCYTNITNYLMIITSLPAVVDINTPMTTLLLLLCASRLKW